MVSARDWNDLPLPPGWEMRYDPKSKLKYARALGYNSNYPAISLTTNIKQQPGRIPVRHSTPIGRLKKWATVEALKLMVTAQPLQW